MDASLSSLYQHAPPPSHYPYYHEPPAQQPPPAQSRSLQLLPAYSLSQQPLPPPASHYALHPPAPHHDEVRTLFIAGLPDDCKSREIYNLFREFPGYQSSYLRTSTESSRPYAFAVFDDHQSTVAALEALNGFIFDLEKDSTLYIELAKSNSKSSQRPRRGIGSNMHMSGKGSSAYNTYDNPSTQSHTSFDHVDAHNADPKTQAASRAYVPQNNPPCPTLFMANLGPTCSEQELTQILSKYPGFLKLKMQNKHGVAVAFADFQDIPSSTGALNSLQGTMLSASSGEPVRIEYSKSRMGLRRRDR
ncbi:hypothetical protein KSP39_PZI001745 [Platanthera zijinensis]|uniref:RRM domain-containing protein n=1 Tax=Platanthera zijinensis TaxID=2320716 RepID=A0AAP0GEI5_9ASPA